MKTTKQIIQFKENLEKYHIIPYGLVNIIKDPKTILNITGEFINGILDFDYHNTALLNNQKKILYTLELKEAKEFDPQSKEYQLEKELTEIFINSRIIDMKKGSDYIVEDRLHIQSIIKSIVKGHYTISKSKRFVYDTNGYYIYELEYKKDYNKLNQQNAMEQETENSAKKVVQLIDETVKMLLNEFKVVEQNLFIKGIESTIIKHRESVFDKKEKELEESRTDLESLNEKL